LRHKLDLEDLEEQLRSEEHSGLNNLGQAIIRILNKNKINFTEDDIHDFFLSQDNNEPFDLRSKEFTVENIKKVVAKLKKFFNIKEDQENNPH
jgi:hypothetical protein